METGESLPSNMSAKNATKMLELELPVLGDDLESSPSKHSVFRVSVDTRGPGREDEGLNRLPVERLRVPG